MRSAADLVRFFKMHGKAHSPLLILTHDHPDPDAIASAMALAYLARTVAGVRCRMAYSGILGRMENKTMVRALKVPIYPLRVQTDFKRFKHVALVDTQPPFGNNAFPEGAHADLVIDHHHTTSAPQARQLWIAPGVGATSTLLGKAVLRLNRPVPVPLATALIYGILSETQDLGRETSAWDIQVYQALLPFCDLQKLSLIRNPQRPGSFYKTLNRSLDRAFVVNDLVGVHLGFVHTPDLVSQTADFLLTYEGMRWAFCTGRFQGKLHVSARALRPKRHVGKLLKEILPAGPGNAGQTQAGGHRTMAGGALVLNPPLKESVWRRAEKEIAHGLFKRLIRRRKLVLRYPFRTER